LRHERTGEKSWRIRFIEAGRRIIHEAFIEARPSEFHNYITCQSAEEKRVVQYVLNDYRATGDATGG
jgi:hypothetical protein